jgi:hypothetical protein
MHQRPHNLMTTSREITEQNSLNTLHCNQVQPGNPIKIQIFSVPKEIVNSCNLQPCRAKNRGRDTKTPLQGLM